MDSPARFQLPSGEYAVKFCERKYAFVESHGHLRLGTFAYYRGQSTANGIGDPGEGKYGVQVDLEIRHDGDFDGYDDEREVRIGNVVTIRGQHLGSITVKNTRPNSIVFSVTRCDAAQPPTLHAARAISDAYDWWWAIDDLDALAQRMCDAVKVALKPEHLEAPLTDSDFAALVVQTRCELGDYVPDRVLHTPWHELPSYEELGERARSMKVAAAHERQREVRIIIEATHPRTRQVLAISVDTLDVHLPGAPPSAPSHAPLPAP